MIWNIFCLYLPGRIFWISFHWLPRRIWAWNIFYSSSGDHASLVSAGSRWNFHLNSNKIKPFSDLLGCAAKFWMFFYYITPYFRPFNESIPGYWISYHAIFLYISLPVLMVSSSFFRSFVTVSLKEYQFINV